MTITKTDLTEALNNFSKTTFEPALKRLEEKMATKDDLKNFITKEDAKNFATKDDLKNFATKDDLKNFATKDDLKNFATKDDLKNFATKDDLKNFATKDNLKDFATKDDMQEISKALLFITNNTYTKKEWDQKFSNIVRKVEIQIEHYRSEFRSAVDGYDHLNTKVKNHEKRITKLEERI